MNGTVRSIVYVFTGAAFAKVFTASMSFILAGMLPPAEYGVWISLTLVSSYAGIAHLGTVEAMLKLYPFQTGQGEFHQARETEQSTFGAVIAAAACLGTGALLLPDFLPGRENIATLLRLVGGAAAVSLLSTFAYHRLTSHGEFRLVGMTDTFRAACSFALILALAVPAGLAGAVWGFFLAEVAVCLQSLTAGWRRCGPVTPLFSPGKTAGLIRTGFPITLVWWICIMQISVDRIVAATTLGKEAAGYYGLGSSIVMTLAMIPQVVGQVLYPRMSHGIGSQLDRAGMEEIVVLPARALSLLLPLAIGPMILLAPLLFEVFPRYRPGLVSAQILIAGSFFVCQIKNGAAFLIASHRQSLLLGYAAACLAVNIAAGAAAARGGAGIEGIALCSIASSALLAALVWKKVFALLGYGPSGQAVELCHLCLPFLLLCLLLGIGTTAFPGFVNREGIHAAEGAAALILCQALLFLRVAPLNRWSRGFLARARHGDAGAGEEWPGREMPVTSAEASGARMPAKGELR